MSIPITSEGHYKTEDGILKPWAQKSRHAGKTRLHGKIPGENYRTPFQRDRDRILHSKAFRRLMHKTQVFYSQSGEHIRNRLTHTLEVMQISTSLSKSLGLNEDLTEAIALGHDLGHTPFGHTVEAFLEKVLGGEDKYDEKITKKLFGQDYKLGPLGGFKHNWQSLKVIDLIEDPYEHLNPGIDLTLAVREGILKHTKFLGNYEHYLGILNTKNLFLDIPHSISLEGQIVALSDEIAQRTHDFEDGLRSDVINIRDVYDEIKRDKLTLISKALANFKHDPDIILEGNDSIRRTVTSSLINLYIKDVTKTSSENILHKNRKGFNWNEGLDIKLINFSKDIEEHDKEFETFLYKEVYNNQLTNRMDSKAQHVISNILKAYYNDPRRLPSKLLKYYSRQTGRTYLREMYKSEVKEEIARMQECPIYIRTICDHIAGMTDKYAFDEYQKLFQPFEFV